MTDAVQPEAAHAGVTSATGRRTSDFQQAVLRIATAVVTVAYSLYRVHPAVWRLMARNYRPWMGRFARLHAWMTCQFAALDVPAYASSCGDGWRSAGSTWPATRRPQAVLRAGVPGGAALLARRLEIAGSVVDESSGSSGQPFNWVRGRRELRSVHKNLAGYTTLVFPRGGGS